MLNKLSSNYYFIVGIFMTMFCSLMIVSGAWYMPDNSQLGIVTTVFVGGVTAILTMLIIICMKEWNTGYSDYKIVQESGNNV